MRSLIRSIQDLMRRLATAGTRGMPTGLYSIIVTVSITCTLFRSMRDHHRFATSVSRVAQAESERTEFSDLKGKMARESEKVITSLAL